MSMLSWDFVFRCVFSLLCHLPLLSLVCVCLLWSPPAVCPCDEWCGRGCSGLLQVLLAQLSLIKAHQLTAYLPPPFNARSLWCLCGTVGLPCSLLSPAYVKFTANPVCPCLRWRTHSCKPGCRELRSTCRCLPLILVFYLDTYLSACLPALESVTTSPDFQDLQERTLFENFFGNSETYISSNKPVDFLLLRV